MKSLAILMSFFSISAFAQSALVDGKYNIDPAHTRVGFEVGHFVFSKVQGRFNEVSGTFDVSRDLKKCNLNVTIPVSSIDTAVAQRDTHLKSADFFDAGKFPQMTFKSKKCSGTLEDLKIVGDLTIKGVTREVTMDAEYQGSAKDPWGNQRAAFTADFEIKRSDFKFKFNEMMELGPQVGDKIEVELISEMTLDQGKPKK